MADLSSHLEECRRLIDAEMDRYFQVADDAGPGIKKLEESIRYSVTEGGKRFRPALSLFTAKALGRPYAIALPYALAVEFVHTYSLIHDDLPCMDDDDERRGRSTNHKVFGEATALLAGDALLTEAFVLISKSGHENPVGALRSIEVLSSAAGRKGMVGGQAEDLLAQREKVTEEALRQLHQMKTGALIEASVVGAAHLCGATSQQLESLTAYARNLGLAFQVADDLLDFVGKEELGNYCALWGVEKTKSFLKDLTASALDHLSSWGEAAELLREVVRFNSSRRV